MKDQEAGWLERLGGETSAEGIDDRISNNAYRIGPTGDVNMREATAGADPYDLPVDEFRFGHGPLSFN